MDLRSSLTSSHDKQLVAQIRPGKGATIRKLMITSDCKKNGFAMQLQTVAEFRLRLACSDYCVDLTMAEKRKECASVILLNQKLDARMLG